MKHAVRCCLLWLCLAAIASPAAAEVTLYVSIAGENRIALYALDQESGELAHRGDVVVKGDPGPLTVDPQRKYDQNAVTPLGDRNLLIVAA